MAEWANCKHLNKYVDLVFLTLVSIWTEALSTQSTFNIIKREPDLKDSWLNKQTKMISEQTRDFICLYANYMTLDIRH